MIHFTCDMCGKSIDAEKDDRFRVLIDVEQMHPGEDDSDLENDFPDDFDELQLESEDSQEWLFRSFKFDLCRPCAEAYLNDPLVRKMPRRMRLMDN